MQATVSLWTEKLITLWFLLIYIHLKVVNALSDSKGALLFSLNMRHHYPLPATVVLSKSSVFSLEQMGKVLKGYSPTYHQQQKLLFNINPFIILIAFPHASNLRKLRPLALLLLIVK